MSLLTPLYVLGLAAITLPVLFHLIRRMPRGEMQFSSLMFLSPSPPRLTRRSRLENILLLVLRAAALSLLAFAFARPFLRQQVPLTASDADQRRLAFVVDTSASMRRGDLWSQGTQMLDKAVADARPFDQIAVFTCDETLRPLISFAEMAQIPPQQRRQVIQQRLKDIGPTWSATRLGQGLMDAVELVNNLSETPGNQQRIARRIVLVSDLQLGSRLDALADYPWPEDVELEVQRVQLAENSNAGLHRLADRRPSASQDATADVRVRVSNDARSATAEFELQWQTAQGRPIGETTAAYVPPGESRTVRVRRPNGDASRLRLRGDSHDFDNTLHFASRTEVERTVVYLGPDLPNDPLGMRYYLERAVADGLARPVRLVSAGDAPSAVRGFTLALQSPAETPLVVAAAEPTEAQTDELRRYAEDGGTVLFVLTAETPTAGWASLLKLPPLAMEEAQVDGYTMLRQIAFDHPLFAPMAGPHFNDFTQIHFWKHRRVKPELLRDANIIARFENGDPALAEWRLGKGRVFVLTSGWHPSDSQWARSWKFVLFVSALVESGAGKSDRVYFLVNEPLPLDMPQVPDGTNEVRITKPDGRVEILAENARAFTATEEPGIYTIATPEGTEVVAVNLDPQESRTGALGIDTLEQFGARLVNPNTLAKTREREQHLQDIALESRQKIWQWLVVSALGILVAETWLAGRASTPSLTEGNSA